LTAEQREVLAAAAGRILPSDDGPGAAETEAAGYVERVLEGERLGSRRPLFVQGLERLQELALQAYGLAFAACAPAEQDEVLGRLQESAHPLHRTFFQELVRLVLEGFLCDPVHGGNRGGLGWSYLGVPEVATGHCLAQPRRPAR
jgi:hypothetical protein